MNLCIFLLQFVAPVAYPVGQPQFAYPPQPVYQNTSPFPQPQPVYQGKAIEIGVETCFILIKLYQFD